MPKRPTKVDRDTKSTKNRKLTLDCSKQIPIVETFQPDFTPKIINPLITAIKALSPTQAVPLDSPKTSSNTSSTETSISTLDFSPFTLTPPMSPTQANLACSADAYAFDPLQNSFLADQQQQLYHGDLTLYPNTAYPLGGGISLKVSLFNNFDFFIKSL